MKFCRLLRLTAQHLPEMQGLFEQYKELKKQIKRIQVVLSHGNFHGWNEYEDQFAEALKRNLATLNDTFLEREEQMVMRLELLEVENRGIVTPQACASVIRRFVDFHGELVLFMHWSMLAYTSIAKILKKHQKKTGATVLSLQIENLVAQPFYSLEVCQDLIQQVENAVRDLLRVHQTLYAQQAMGGSSTALAQGNGRDEWNACQIRDSLLQDDQEQEQETVGIAHQMQIALATWERLRTSAATPSTLVQPLAEQAASCTSSHYEQDEF